MVSDQQVRTSTNRKHERGVALLMCLFALLLLTGVAMAMIFMSDTDMTINNNYRDAQQAYFAAYAGLQEARVRLITAGPPDVHPTTMPTTLANTGVTYIRNRRAGETITMADIQDTTSRYFDDQFCQENFNGFSCTVTPAGSYATLLDSTDPNYGTNNALDYKWVRITMKNNLSTAPYSVIPASTDNTTRICWDGTKQLMLPGGASCEANDLTTVYRLTSLAIGRGGSRRKLQMEVANDPPLVTKGAVDSQDHVTLNGKLEVNGYDYCSCDCSWQNVGGVDTYVCSNRGANICDQSKYAIYAHGEIDEPNEKSNSELLLAGTSPLPYVEGADWPYDMDALVERYKNAAGTVKLPCNGTSPCYQQQNGVYGVPPAFPPSPADDPVANPDWGNPSSQVTYIPGDAKLTAHSLGNGILVVDGDLEISGGLSFYGLILVKGVVKFTGGGAGNATNIYGAVLAGQRSLVDNVFGGSANIHFDRCALDQNKDPQPPVMLSLHELSF